MTETYIARVLLCREEWREGLFSLVPLVPALLCSHLIQAGQLNLDPWCIESKAGSFDHAGKVKLRITKI